MERILGLGSSYDPLACGIIPPASQLKVLVRSGSRLNLGRKHVLYYRDPTPLPKLSQRLLTTIASFGQSDPALKASSNLSNTVSMLGHPLHSTFQQLSSVFQSESVNATSGRAGSLPPINSSTAIHSPRLGKGLCPQMTYSSFISGTATKLQKPYVPRR